ncbi:glycosyltransferase [Thalassomonas sp. M1454]|uniref:glycosyltransferase n=1 Tax=Thalassomonas sp. M1454 TaxID=2594477 RepID=UPI001180320D|nr:glycosyltransferase family A protein [Thalassomonas sp. M1454]TRX57932.1 glycosyltransferase family 2 protein [Thalassomonas sp. M1454]
MAVQVSFIIPHKGREEMLVQTLDSIFAQDFMQEFEVIVVSQNEFFAAEKLFIEKTNLKVIQASTALTISALRNYGAKLAKGEYFAFLDADIDLAPNWLTKLLNTLTANSDIALISAIQKNSPSEPALEQIRTALSNADIDTFVSFLPGRNLLLSAATFKKVHGFPEHLTTCEDYYFTHKVSELGKLLYSSKSHYVHLGEDKEFLPMFKKEIWRGQSNLGSISGRIPPLRELPSFIIPILLLLLLVISLFAIITLQSQLFISCITLMLIPVVIYSIRLFFIAQRKINIVNILKFYLLYFPARAIGTLLSIKTWIQTLGDKSNG